MKHLTFKKKYHVQMIIECRPSLLEHLLEEICATAKYENAFIQTYSFEEVNESESKSDD